MAKKNPVNVQTSAPAVSPIEEPVKPDIKAPAKTARKAPSEKKEAVVKQNDTTTQKEEIVKTDTEDTTAQTTEDANSGENIIKGLLEKVGTINLQVKVIQTSLKQLLKEFDKQKKIIDKVQKKREKAKKSPSGFAKPCKISDELCDFMGIPKGTEQSRTDITRHINSYVKENNLNNPANRREFFPDKKLKSILNIKEGEKVTYFILQRLIAHHFPPSQSKLAAAKV